jgi:hypothetical protein
MMPSVPKTTVMAAFVIFFVACCGSAPAHAVTLLTQEDIDRGTARGQEKTASDTVCTAEKCYEMPASFAVIETRYATGPRIEVVEPPADAEYRAPIRLIISFMPREGTQVDLKTFKLEYLKVISIDITGRVAGYLEPTGVRIEKADLPPGDHKLRITLKDTKGGISQQVYSVKIAK